MAPADESQDGSRPRTLVGAALLVAYVVVVAWFFYEQSTSWPHEGSWALVAYVFLCPGILFQAFRLAYTRRTGRPLTRRWLARAVTIPLGLVLAAALASWASTLAMGNFDQAYAPFVSQVGANLADPCRLASRYFEIPSVAAYNSRAQRDRPLAKLKYDNKRFVLAFDGGSMDIDGSTIYYDSGVKAWRKFHNDNSAARGVYAGLTEGLVECSLRAQ